MEVEQFKALFKEYLDKIKINVEDSKIEKFFDYMNLLISWNQKINLTAITEEKEIIIKHFIDSLTINKYIENYNKIYDIGTGAGFPGIPLKILNDNKEFTLIDALNKRIVFLNEIKDELELKQIELIHGRVEDLAKNIEYREKGEVVVSRAVANLSTLVEYMLPFAKIGGICICMKGNKILEELKNAEKAINILGGELEKIDNFVLPGSDLERNIVIIRKIKNTASKYPRKAGIPSKKPL